MKLSLIKFFILFTIISGCVGTSSTGIFGTGVSVALDPRSLGTQIMGEKSKSEVIDIKIKEEFNFKRSAEDILITSQLRSALIFNKEIKAVNYNLDTYKKKIYIYGIAHSKEERQNVVDEAKNITDVEDVIASILLVEDLRVQKD